MSDARPAVDRGVQVWPDISVPRPRICPRETVHRNPFHTVEAVLAESQGFAMDYSVVDFGPRVGIVAAREGMVLLTAQRRASTTRARCHGNRGDIVIIGGVS